MHDIGFEPARSASVGAAVRGVVKGSIDGGFRNPPVRWLMLAAPFSAGAGIFVFYAAQPYLLELYGDKTAYGIAGLAAAIVAGAQILGGIAAPRIRGLFRRRTSALLLMAAASVVTLVMIGAIQSFWPVIGFTTIWGLLFAATMPIRQTYINGMIPSRQRATILSFDSMMSSTGGVWAQPVLGRAADVWGYAQSYTLSAGIAAFALPFIALSRRQDDPADTLDLTEAQPAPQPA
jgi:MFS family permease